MSDITIGSLLPSNSNAPAPITTTGRLIGVEIEAEKVTSWDNDWALDSGWLITTDDSLRNSGREFITKPLRPDQLMPMLLSFYSEFDKWKWQATKRTGIHIHVDARDFTPKQLSAAATAYILSEVAFFDQVGPEREENIYCVPWYRADSDVSHVANFVRQIFSTPDTKPKSTGPKSINHLLKMLKDYLCKYSAWYLEPLTRFGTIEFRHAPTFQSAQKLYDWAIACHHWTSRVQQFNSPGEVLAKFKSSTPRQFAMELLGETAVILPDYNARFDSRDCVILAETLALSSGELEEETTWLSLIDEVPADVLQKYADQMAAGAGIAPSTTIISAMASDFIYDVDGDYASALMDEF